MKKINYILIVVVSILGINLVGLFYILAYTLNQGNQTASVLPESATRILKTKGKPLTLEVAETRLEQVKGLSFRNSLPYSRGLLFVFAHEDLWGIWMKDMKFPIDIMWMDKDFKVVSLKENVSPDTYPTVFQPEKPVLYVLETNTGFIKENGITIGSKLNIE